MKTGKITQAALDRSVLRPLSRAKALAGDAGIGVDGAILRFMQEETEVVTSIQTAALTGRLDLAIEDLLGSVWMNLLIQGEVVQVDGLLVSVMLGAENSEDTLKDIVTRAGQWCQRQGCLILGGDTKVSAGITRPVVSVTGIGHRMVEAEKHTAKEMVGKAIVMAGYTGAVGGRILAEAYADRLSTMFPPVILDGAEQAAMPEKMEAMARTASRLSMAVKDVSTGGVFAALWDLAEREKIGFSVQLDALPIRQETIEICEVFAVNPYQLYGQGALLAVTAQPEAYLAAMCAQDIPASVIGYVTEGQARVIRHGEEVRYLDKPQADALWALAERENW